MIYGSYRIIYVKKQHICFIVAVVHSSRDLIRLLQPGEWDIKDFQIE
jgi:hypothetical protein